LAPLAAVTGVSFVSLQKGEAAAQAAAPPPGMVLHDIAADLHDFADTAAALTALDLVITVDTAVAHLAGALGQRVWVMNRRYTDWRWLLEREDSPWYPTARLFRQKTRGDWGPVIGEIAAMLANEHALVGEIAPKPHPARA
jgi:ADP-heptose:LPS heptosyltransferase